MGRRTYIALAIWFVFVVSCVMGAYVPLHYWSSQLRLVMPQGTQLVRLSGHWWRGQAQVSVMAWSQPLQFSWSLSSLFEPITWHLNHPKVVGYGQLQPTMNSLSLWVEGLRMEADLLNPSLAPQGVHLSGQAIEITRWFSVYDFSQAQFQAFRAHAHWGAGRIEYQVEQQTIAANIENWQLHGDLFIEAQEPQPRLTLRSQQDRPLFELKLLPSQELELTVMPELIEALGQRWPGKKEYPAFVMVQPLTGMWRY
ncbi:hypothetical protein MAQ5080_02252 [Marinomonas aquimarina]|uniref:General secretion pathway protein N n=1 Tax=Marinomonas aquimarina TaxID=295068 RepID=A0A1A8TI28_9GAMM|nr:hypothetical protein [Marinomonas aquimarina]SBS32393.1 hypothetical protein MAQ5080_02252 [Marinomonas aquimarina]